MNNYYAIIPSQVRYDDKLTPNAKLLYGEIVALTNDKGYCWANNKYFAELYKTDPRTIRRWLEQLKALNHIKIQYILNGQNVDSRRIRTVDNNVLGGGQKSPRGEGKNVRYNSIYNTNNNTKNNTSTKSVETKKSTSDFSGLVLKSLDAFCELFPERNRPKTEPQKIKWLSVIDLANKKDKINPRQLYLICKKAREDEFWSENFFSMAGIRNKKNGVSKLDRFISKFGKDIDQLK